MRNFSILWGLSLFSQGRSLLPNLFQAPSSSDHIPQARQTKILGSSFGIPTRDAIFDYIVVGAGTAGLTITKRLAEDSLITVAVIEPGGFYETENGNESVIPASSSSSLTGIQPLIDWGFITEPQPLCEKNYVIFTVTQSNVLLVKLELKIFYSATEGTYGLWADLVGDKSYAYDNLLPYFKSGVKFTPPNVARIGTDASLISYHTTTFSSAGGPLQVSYQNYVQPITRYFYHAMQSLGFGSNPGSNTGRLLGLSFNTFNIDPQKTTRSSSKTSFLDAAIASTSRQIYQPTTAQKVLFEENKKAIGFNVSTAGVSYILSVSKELILSAGTFRSPQMLMLSGIGPAATLSKHDIPVLSDLASVRQNMWDQPLFSVVYPVNVTTFSALANQAYLNQATMEYLTEQTGPLCDVGVDILGVEKLPPESRSHLSPGTLADLATFPADWPEVYYAPFAAPFALVTDASMYASVAAAISTLTSRGNFTLASTDARGNPLVSPNWLLSKTDQEVAIQALRRARKIWKASGIIAGPEIAPGEAVQIDEEILSYLRAATGSISHYCATCAMGKPSHPMTVVDSQARIIGVTGLRVVDASAFPFAPPGVPQASVYMLAEKIADKIKNGQ